MEDSVGQKLRELVAEYGPAIGRDPKRLRGLLFDYCGEYRVEIAALMCAIEERVVADLLVSPQSMPWTLI